jgi:hypothetical protein
MMYTRKRQPPSYALEGKTQSRWEEELVGGGREKDGWRGKSGNRSQVINFYGTLAKHAMQWELGSGVDTQPLYCRRKFKISQAIPKENSPIRILHKYPSIQWSLLHGIKPRKLQEESEGQPCQ